jgi:hypothetical protein
MRLPKLPILLDHPLLGERASGPSKFGTAVKPFLAAVISLVDNVRTYTEWNVVRALQKAVERRWDRALGSE